MTGERTLTPAPAAAGDDRGKVRWWSPMFTVRLVHVALWAVVVSGPIVAAVAIAEAGGLGDRIATIEATSLSVPLDTTEAEGLALVAVANHLTEAGWAMGDTATVAVTEVAPEVFAITVAAHITPPDVAVPVAPPDVAAADGGDTGDVDGGHGGRRVFFEVAVTETAGGWVTSGAPSVVTGPEPPLVAEPTRGGRLDTDPGLEDTVVRFLAAYLTGGGDVERYTAPDTDIKPVAPAPFTEVEIGDAGWVRDGDGSLLVTVTVDAVDAAGASLTVGYTLSVVERDGRFEVALLLPPLPAGAGDPVHEKESELRDGGVS